MYSNSFIYFYQFINTSVYFGETLKFSKRDWIVIGVKCTLSYIEFDIYWGMGQQPQQKTKIRLPQTDKKNSNKKMNSIRWISRSSCVFTDNI